MIERVELRHSHGLRVGVGEVRLRHQDFRSNRAYCTELSVFARQDLTAAGSRKPFTNVAVLADASPDFRCGLVHVDFESDGHVDRVRGSQWRLLSASTTAARTTRGRSTTRRSGRSTPGGTTLRRLSHYG